MTEQHQHQHELHCLTCGLVRFHDSPDGLCSHCQARKRRLGPERFNELWAHSAPKRGRNGVARAERKQLHRTQVNANRARKRCE